jgi:hypothetical protein
VKLRQGLETKDPVKVKEHTPSSAQKEIVAEEMDWIENDYVGARYEVQHETSRGVSGLGSAEFPLPLFDKNAGVNPPLHLRHLEEFLQFKGIPE